MNIAAVFRSILTFGRISMLIPGRISGIWANFYDIDDQWGTDPDQVDPELAGSGSLDFFCVYISWNLYQMVIQI